MDEEEAEENWKFQADILRAECNFLRAEREFAFKKIEKNRLLLETTLSSAIQTLVSGRRKIREENRSGLDEEIDDLGKRVRELRKMSSVNSREEVEVRECSNFDKQASLLQRRVAKMGEQEKRVKECQDDATCSGKCREVVKKVMEQVSAETKQWGEMQEILTRVGVEMKELQSSRDIWEHRALRSHSHSHALRFHVKQWKGKALALQNQLSILKTDNKSADSTKLGDRAKPVQGSRKAQASPTPKRTPLQDIRNNVSATPSYKS